LNPEWNVTFEMPVLGVPLLECICWDHDRFGKDYLGEFDIALEDIFADGEIQQQVCTTVVAGHRSLLHCLKLMNCLLLAKMVHPQVESEIREEKRQQRIGRNPSAVLPV
jgi:hypothetical protein